jgi:hypothetical protein
LLQEGENDVALSSETIACESSRKELNPKVASSSTFEDVSNDVANKVQLVITKSHDPPLQIFYAAGEIASPAGALKVDGENLSFVMSSKYPFENETLMDHDSVVFPTDKRDVFDITSKPRTALLQGRDNDESMAPQNIPAENS